jgi:EAL domain-containing protein (putative c-di-GMP-specific phosphodiesterase class I)
MNAASSRRPSILPNIMREFLSPLFQPIFDAHGAIYAHEAFLRMRGSSVEAAGLLPRWERNRLVINADDAMIWHACAIACRTGSRDRLRLSLTVSAVSIDTDPNGLAHRLARVLEHTGGAIVEVPLLAVEHHFARFHEFCHLCQHLGVVVAFDDVKLDTTFASRQLLESVRPGFIKIDGTYLMRLAELPEHARLMSVIESARALGIECIVKNIDSGMMLQLARLSGARYHQGRLLAPESGELQLQPSAVAGTYGP